MPTVNSDVHMMSGLQSAYDSMQSHDTNTLYFCTDTQRYFIGDVEYSRPVQYGTSLPSTYLPPNSLFYNANTRQLFFSKDGASWQVISSIPSINGVELNGELTSSDLDIEPARFIVNVTGSGSSYTADHTYAELVEAYNEGRTIQAVISGVTLNLSQFLSGVRFEFQFSDLQYMEYAVLRISVSNDITFNSDNIVIGTPDIVIASSSSIGGVYAQDYNESNYQSTEIAIDSTGFLHAPKLSINGKELTNSTTAEELNLKRTDFVINVTDNNGTYSADKTFEEIETAYDSGRDLICIFTSKGSTIEIPYMGHEMDFFAFQIFTPLTNQIQQVTIDSENTVEYYTKITLASAYTPGVIYAYPYDDATYSPVHIAIDEYGLLHAPKSIFTVTVTANETADMTFEQIQSAYNNGYYVQASYVGRNIPLVQLTGSTAYFRLLVSEDTSDANLGMVYDIRITSTSVNVSTGYMRATSTQYGLIRADSDTYDETYTKECKMNSADGKLYCQPTMWSFWD